MSASMPDASEHADAVAPARQDPDAEAPPAAKRPRRFAPTRAKIRKFVRREHPPPPALHHVLIKAVLTSITVPVCFVGTFALCWALGVPMSMHPSDPHQPVTPSSEAEDAVVRLIEQHGCWMDSAPPDMEGKDPGHAVVTWPGRRLPTYGGERAVVAGLEHVIEDRHPNLRVHAFCR